MGDIIRPQRYRTRDEFTAFKRYVSNPEVRIREKPVPMKLTKPQFGKPDPELARAVMRNIERTMPPIVVAFQANYHKVSKLLRSHGFVDVQLHHLVDLVRDDRVQPKKAKTRKTP